LCAPAARTGKKKSTQAHDALYPSTVPPPPPPSPPRALSARLPAARRARPRKRLPPRTARRRCNAVPDLKKSDCSRPFTAPTLQLRGPRGQEIMAAIFTTGAAAGRPAGAPARHGRAARRRGGERWPRARGAPGARARSAARGRPVPPQAPATYPAHAQSPAQAARPAAPR
jgi:hypothetical protein